MHCLHAVPQRNFDMRKAHFAGPAARRLLCLPQPRRNNAAGLPSVPNAPISSLATGADGVATRRKSPRKSAGRLGAAFASRSHRNTLPGRRVRAWTTSADKACILQMSRPTICDFAAMLTRPTRKQHQRSQVWIFEIIKFSHSPTTTGGSWPARAAAGAAAAASTRASSNSPLCGCSSPSPAKNGFETHQIS